MANTRKPRAEFWEDTPFVPDIRVYEEEMVPLETGLLDADGRKIYRRVERLPVGFDLRSTKRG